MKLISVVEERKPITVEMSPREVDLILFALNRIGGDPEGPRGDADDIAQFLSKQGAVRLKSDPHHSSHLPDTWEKAYA